jgi:hypothetical protein
MNHRETMQASLRSWSFARVLLVSGSWILAWLLLSLLVVVRSFLLLLRSSGHAGVGAVSFGISEMLLMTMLAVLVVPPAALIASWLVIRRP